MRSPLLLPTDYIRKYHSFFICIAFIFRIVVVAFKAGLLCYSFCSDVDRPAVSRSPDGRSRAEPAFPVLCSGRLWAEYSADSGCCEVSLNSGFELYLFFVVPVSRVFLLMMALLSVGWFGLYGSAPVGCLHNAGQRGLELVGLLHLCFICFHQKGMIAYKKLRHPYHLPRELRQNRVYLYVFVLFHK